MIKSTILRVVNFLHIQSSEPCVVLGCSSGGFCIKSGQRSSRSWHQACTCTLTPSIFVYASDFWACLVMLEWWRCLVMLHDHVHFVSVFVRSKKTTSIYVSWSKWCVFRGKGMHMIRN
jgi:hypothetical protein